MIRSPWLSRDFRMLVTGLAVSGLGSSMAPVALAFAVLGLGGSATDLGYVVALFAAAEVVTILYGGVLGDRLPRQLLMQGSSVAVGISQAVCATVLITGHGSIPFLGVVGVVNGCFGALAQPASSAMTRLTVPAELLARAVVVRALAGQTAYLVGFSAGGIVVAAAGPGWAIAVDAVTYGVAAVFFSLIRARGRGATERQRFLTDLVDGGREVLRHTWLWLLIGQALLYHLLYGGVQGVLGPVVVGDAWGEEAWGWSLSCLMAGFVVGGLVALRWRPQRLLLWGTVLLSLTAAFPLAIGLADSVVLVLLGALAHGVGLQIFGVQWDLAIQENVAEEMLARVYSFDHVGSFVCRPLGLVLTGPVSAWVGVDRWLVLVAVVIAAAALAALGSSSVRDLTRRVVPADPQPSGG